MKTRFTNKNAVGKYFHFLGRHFLPVLVILLGKSSVSAQSSVDILLDPANIAVEVNETFTVDVKVDFGTGTLASVNAYVFFNPADLEVTAKPTVPSPGLLPGISIDFDEPTDINNTGQIRYGRFNSAPIANGTHPAADFVFFTITFRAKRVPPGGTTAITFGNTFPTETGAGEFDTPDALNQTFNGSVTISAAGCTPPSATISAPGGTVTCNGQAFNLMLATAPTGFSPFDITIAGPNGTATYDNIAVGGVITNFTPPINNLWPAAPSPLPPTEEYLAYTLGVRFSSTVNGFVKGVRFFSPDEVVTTTGNYTGQLWSLSGNLIASGTFTGVTANNWQELLFSKPVYIEANTAYIASYNTNASKKYVSTSNGLLSSASNGPLSTLGSVYNTGAAVVFPGTPPLGGSSAHNYWVDVIFSPNEYTFNLTSIKDDHDCISTGTLQSLSVTSVECSTLPVSLLDLSASPRDKSIYLKWTTSSEINNQGFQVQRSVNGSDWIVLGFVNGAGNTTTTRHYDYTDNDLSSGRYYYRLKQVDIDGRFEYSPVVSAVLGGAEAYRLDQNYPNPFRSETILRFSIPQKAHVKLSLFDTQGRLLKVLVNGSKDKGTHAVTVNASALTSGIYYYKLETDNFSAVKKMTVQ